MAQFTYFQAVDMSNPQSSTGTMVGSSANYFAIDDRAGGAGIYYGRFTYGSSGSVSGTVTGYDLFHATQFDTQVRGLSLDAAVVKGLLDAGDLAGVQTLSLTGNDTIMGSSSADVLIGLEGGDLIYGLQGNDSIYGGVGSDVLVGGPGNDLLVGGDGLDFAMFSGTAGQYSASVSSEGYLQITDTLAASRDGVDTLQGVERLMFEDVTLALDTSGAAGQSYRIYKAAFDRQPDTDGLGYWINQMDGGRALVDVAQGFIGSAEFQQLYGANTTNAQFVNLLYQNVLGRDADQSGYDYWLNAMTNGVTRAQVLASFSESSENVANVEPLISNGIYYVPYEA